MTIRSIALLAVMLAGLGGAQAESAAVIAELEAVWKRAECNQNLDQAISKVEHHDLGGGYLLGLLLCWQGSNSEAHVLFVTPPKSKQVLQLLRFQAWRDKKFVPTDKLVMAEYHPDKKSVTSYERYSSSGICASAGEWTWNGKEFQMTGFWDKPDCDDDGAFDWGDRYRIFPPRK